MLTALWLTATPAIAGHLLTGPVESNAVLSSDWVPAGVWKSSEVRHTPDGGTRIGSLVTASPGAAIRLQARGVTAAGEVGPWVTLQETWREDNSRVLVADLEQVWSGGQIRGRGIEGLDTLTWELLTPVDEPRSHSVPPPAPLSTRLTDLGVVSRSDWGSRSTRCTAGEDDWYRFAIHHTAGSQTSGGSVEGAVRALQAYAMDSGGYCDIPYQFLVGYDGSLWEGRPLTYRSGATGGDQNDGNIAVSFLGCYTPSGCPGDSHTAPDGMVAWSRMLVQALAEDHAITTDEDNLRGHGEWPGNATSCPGQYILARLDELRSTSARWQAEVVAASFPIGGTQRVPIAQDTDLWIDLYNAGTEIWTPESTRVAPLPRDTESPAATTSWIAPTRVTAVPQAVHPGETVRVHFTVHLAEPQTLTLSLAMVEEWQTWFADAPLGGGFASGELTVTLQPTSNDTGDSPEGSDSAAPVDSGIVWSDPAGDVPARLNAAPPPPSGCGCRVRAPETGGLVFLLPLLMSLVRRQPKNIVQA